MKDSSLKIVIILIFYFVSACSKDNNIIAFQEQSEFVLGNDINLLCKNDFDMDMKILFPEVVRNDNDGIFELTFLPINNRDAYYKARMNPKLENAEDFFIAKEGLNKEYFKTLPANYLNISLEWSLSNITNRQASKYYQSGVSGIYPVVGASVIVQTPQVLSSLNVEQEFTHQLINSEKNAIDISAPIGSNVIAFKGGVVVWAESRYGDYGCKNSEFISPGNSIFILHEDGTEARYLHLKKGSIRVSVGQVIQSGQLLAEVGNSGPSSGPHLHFQVGGFVNKELSSFPVLFKLSLEEKPWEPYYLQEVESI